jgi:PCO_ADO
MIRSNIKEEPLRKLVKLSSSIASDLRLLEEMSQEIRENKKGPICSMFKSLFKNNLLEDLGVYTDLIQFLFKNKELTEICVYNSVELSVRCLFMPKNSMFPLHEHLNKVVCTGILYGKIKYATFNHRQDKHYILSKKGPAKACDVLFCTEDYRNIRTMWAIEDSILLDIFMPDNADHAYSNSFKVTGKRKRDFVFETDFGMILK